MQRILVIRFSSIGDIVLTSPVVRVLRAHYPDADIRFVTGAAYAGLAGNSPYTNGVFLLDGGLRKLAADLKCFRPDLVIDLHHNLRTRILRTRVGGRWLAFHKLNVEKWLRVNLKIDRLPDLHVVDRYLATLRPLGIGSDGMGPDFFFPPGHRPPELPTDLQNGYVALVVGAKYATKQLPEHKLTAVCNELNRPVALIGGAEDRPLAEEIARKTGAPIWNTCGELDLAGSASVIQRSNVVITHDTGMMHIASALNCRIVSVWGNTIPKFGMYPYLPESQQDHIVCEVPELKCRPCSKIGHSKCPEGHFRCMEQQDVHTIVQAAIRPIG